MFSTMKRLEYESAKSELIYTESAWSHMNTNEVFEKSYKQAIN